MTSLSWHTLKYVSKGSPAPLPLVVFACVCIVVLCYMKCRKYIEREQKVYLPPSPVVGVDGWVGPYHGERARNVHRTTIYLDTHKIYQNDPKNKNFNKRIPIKHTYTKKTEYVYNCIYTCVYIYTYIYIYTIYYTKIQYTRPIYIIIIIQQNRSTSEHCTPS